MLNLTKNSTKKVLILDGTSLLYRAFYALPELSTKKGKKTQGVYGFLLTLFKEIKEIKPNYIFCCFDLPEKTFRHKKFKKYKAQRKKMPEDLKTQIPILEEILTAMEIPIFKKEGYEADDLIATLVKKILEKNNFEIFILSGDYDLLQVLKNNVKLIVFKRGIKEKEIFDEKKVKETFEISPSQIPDLKALAGDQSDNIPGIKGIGKKTAISLLRIHQNIENILEKIKKGGVVLDLSTTKILKEKKDELLFSKFLTTVKENVQIEPVFKKFGLFDEKKFKEILKKYEFFSLIKRISEIKGQKDSLF